MKKNYCYLVERKGDGEQFCTFGNFKEAWNRPSYLYEFVPETYEYAHKTPFGTVSNVSGDLRYNSRDYKVIKQIAV